MGGLIYWSTTPFANQTADPDAAFPEGQPASSLNDSSRGLMAGMAKWALDNVGTLPATQQVGTNDFAVTSNQVIPNLNKSFTLGVMFSAAPTGQTRINVDGTGYRVVQRRVGVDAETGDIQTGIPYFLTYNQPTDKYLLKGIDRDYNDARYIKASGETRVIATTGELRTAANIVRLSADLARFVFVDSSSNYYLGAGAGLYLGSTPMASQQYAVDRRNEAYSYADSTAVARRNEAYAYTDALRPNGSPGSPGYFVTLGGGNGTNVALPAGGTWAYYMALYDNTTGGINIGSVVASVAAGGTVVGGANPGYTWKGFAWRVS